MSAVATLTNLTGLIGGLVSGINPSRAAELYGWVQSGGLESLKPELLAFLKCKAEAKAAGQVCRIDGKIDIKILPPLAPFAETLDVTIEPSTTVAETKSKLEAFTGVPAAEQRLVYQDGKELGADQNMLAAYLHGGAPNTIMMVLARHKIPIYTAPGAGVEIEVTIDSTVKDARELVEASTGVPWHQISLVLGEALPLDDAQFIYDTWVESGKQNIRAISTLSEPTTVDEF